MWINKLRINYEKKKSPIKIFVNKIKNNKFSPAVSSIIGTVIILGLSVMFFSIIYYSVITVPYSPPSPSSNIYYSYEGTKVIVTHFGGPALDLQTEIQIHIGDDSPIITKVKDYLNEEAIDDNYWGFGEQFVYDTSVDILNNTVNVIVIDHYTDSVVSIGKKG